MTSLIDVIFLLLMFFMLASTFTRTVDLPLTASQAAGGGFADSRIVFLRLSPEQISLNGRAVPLAQLPQRIQDLGGPEPKVLISLSGPVTSQALASLLAQLQAVPGIGLQVLG
ncbi:MAG: biopolymer transporter ExbD [Rhodobacteraceae bacterium]|nr:biopolymer transporter ExbD [Paracoccaceae bacterium]MBT26447.1 biopolymer transporter ExbD [Paracoccaceae bacterium]